MVILQQRRCLEAVFILICSGAGHELPPAAAQSLNKSHLQAAPLRFPRGGEGECLISPLFSHILLLRVWDFYIFPTVSTFNISGFSGAGQGRRQQHIYLSLHASRAPPTFECAQEQARPNRQTAEMPNCQSSICKKGATTNASVKGHSPDTICSGRITSSGPVLDFYRTQVSLGSILWVRMSVCPSVTKRAFADLN